MLTPSWLSTVCPGSITRHLWKLFQVYPVSIELHLPRPSHHVLLDVDGKPTGWVSRRVMRQCHPQDTYHLANPIVQR